MGELIVGRFGKKPAVEREELLPVSEASEPPVENDSAGSAPVLSLTSRLRRGQSPQARQPDLERDLIAEIRASGLLDTGNRAKARQLVREIRGTIRSLAASRGGVIKPGIYRENMVRYQDQTVDELIAILEISTATEWQRSPSLYAALTDILEKKLTSVV